MSLINAVPGKTFSTTLYLPQPATGVVKWTVRDPTGKMVLKGQCPPANTTVVITGVLPSSAYVPEDNSKYSITASDGRSSAVEYFSVIAQTEVDSHGYEIAYLVQNPFKDTLVAPALAEDVSVKIVLTDGTWPIPPHAPIPIDDPPIRKGNSYLYSFSYANTLAGRGTVPAGVIDTHIHNTFGTGNVIWDYTLRESEESHQEIHPFYTITAHTMPFLTAIRMLVDKARIGDINGYLEYTMSDLCHSFMRGCEYVMQSPPVAGGWGLNQTPIALKDPIVKASALDILRAQYLAEGMSQFDLQGLRTSLTVDRSQYLSQLIGELQNDLDNNLMRLKNEWLAQGAPMGAIMAGGRRPIGVLGLTRGVYSPWPMCPLPVITGGYQFLGGGYGYGPLI